MVNRYFVPIMGDAFNRKVCHELGHYLSMKIKRWCSILNILSVTKISKLHLMLPLAFIIRDHYELIETYHLNIVLFSKPSSSIKATNAIY